MNTRLAFALLFTLTIAKSFAADNPESASRFDATTFFIRVDGGTAEQCTGKTDAPYPGSGSQQACAWSHPFWALNGSGQWKIQGGDTLILRTGSYQMGYGAPNTAWCSSAAAYDCMLPPIPSGPDPGHPTRLLGIGCQGGYSNAPELWGTQRPWHIMDLTKSSNVQVECLEITDHSGCVEHHADQAARCQRDSYPFGDWAAVGILAVDSSNVTLRHLNIHGLASGGVSAGRLSNWTVEDVRIACNGWVGWDGDIDGLDSNSGDLIFRKWLVEWNGCGETYPGQKPHGCWSQTAGGYGDGVGTGSTGGHWIIEDSIFRYNTSDGLDLLYARENDSLIEIRRSQAYGNAGNQMKTNGPAKIENSIVVGNCGFFEGKSFTYGVDNCRAAGNTLSLSVRRGSAVSVINSTIAGQGDCLAIFGCDDDSCTGIERLVMQNNIFLGSREFGNSGEQTCFLWMDRDGFYKTELDYNIIYGVKGGALFSAHDLALDPLLQNTGLEQFDARPRNGSPAIDSGLATGSLNGLIPTEDILRARRPYGAGTDRGAYELGAAAPSLTLLTPNGGENWKSGSSQTITWSSAGLSGRAQIELYRQGIFQSEIGSADVAPGTFAWIIPRSLPSASNYVIRIAIGGVEDLSDKAFSIAVPILAKKELIGTWSGQGVYYRNANTGNWVLLASPATMLAVGDMDGDGVDDIAGNWPSQGGIWARLSSTGRWILLASPAEWIACGDLNGDGRADLIGSWANQGVFYLDVTSVGGNAPKWSYLASPASQVAAADLDGDGKEDLIGTWPSEQGMWARLSSTQQWIRLASAPDWVTSGDLNGDGRREVIATWADQGVFYFQSSSLGSGNLKWVQLSSAASMITTGDFDGDGIEDLAGSWPSQGGLWIQYSSTGQWLFVGSAPDWLAAGRIRSDAASLNERMRGR